MQALTPNVLVATITRMNRLSSDKRKAVISSLVEGASINSTVRITGVSKPTILKLLADLGCACAAYHHGHVRGLKPARIECDEVWSFVYCKAKNVSKAESPVEGAGDCWTWTAIDPDSKMILTYHVGLRSYDDAVAFMLDLSERITNKTQLTTDGFGAYPAAVRNAFGQFVDYGQLVKVFKGTAPDHARYSPAECVGCRKERVIGAPDFDTMSTSIVERSNLTIRMGMRRFTRLTNGHSKKVENHGHALAVFFMFYNYCRVHSTMKTSPAVKVGLADHVWTMDELIGLLD
ncbi:MAG: IS1 family transposase [Phycisphaerales bacterium]|nr:IS1 family transposase [Phycisphaerales bacterium]